MAAIARAHHAVEEEEEALGIISNDIN